MTCLAVARRTSVRHLAGSMAGRSRLEIDFRWDPPADGRCSSSLDTPAIPNGGARLRVLPGPQDDFFAEPAFTLLERTRFLVTPQSNRMGYRLSGAGIPRDLGSGNDLRRDIRGCHSDTRVGRADSAHERSTDDWRLSADGDCHHCGSSDGGTARSRRLGRVRSLHTSRGDRAACAIRKRCSVVSHKPSFRSARARAARSRSARWALAARRDGLRRADTSDRRPRDSSVVRGARNPAFRAGWRKQPRRL